MKNTNTPVISFIAKSGTGKTTLIEKVIKGLKALDYKVAVIKHDAHRFDMDKPGKDSWKMAQAGADIVVISSPEKVALIEKVEEEKTLDDVIAMLSPVDLILTEGFKFSANPRIEVFRAEVTKELLSEPHELLAIASDVQWNIGVPCYHIDDADGVVNEIIKYMDAYHKLAIINRSIQMKM
ncbi:MAG: molybdopterin-guanine dinucleotide biosynthesis protein B [Bacillota bacterium]|nr:molybdopterin-guanine dinucleotide biosynthesis protein B [Bacillota bacterium]